MWFGKSSETKRERIVMNTVNEMTPMKFSCEVINTGLVREYAFLRRGGHNEILKVPVRKNGITSWGRAYRCHFNCNILLHWVGGKILRGYMIKKTGTAYKLDYHSVWINPEGRAVCVTRYPDDAGVDYRLFLPIDESSVDDPFVIYPDIDVIKVGGKKYKVQLSALNTKAGQWQPINKWTKDPSSLSKTHLKKTAMSLVTNESRKGVAICSSESVIEAFSNGGFDSPEKSLKSRWLYVQKQFLRQYESKSAKISSPANIALIKATLQFLLTSNRYIQ